MRLILSGSLVALVAICASLALVVTSASANTPTTKFITVTCDLNGQTTVSGWKGNPTDLVLAWTDANGTFASAVDPGDVGPQPNSVTVDTPTVLSDNFEPIAKVLANFDYGTGLYPVQVWASCS